MGLVSTHQLSTFTTPVNGTSPIDANQVKGNDNSIKTSYNAHDADTTIHLQSGAVATRPAASTAGQTWLATDSGAVYLYLDNGSAWVEANYLRNTGGTVTGNVLITGTLGVTGATTLSSTLTIGGVTYTFPASQGANQYLKTDGSGNLSWVTFLDTLALTDLSDVTITSVASGQFLLYNGTVWVNGTNGSALTTLNASNLSSGTVNTARVAGSYTGITAVGTLTAGAISTGFTAIADTFLATISTASKVSNSATTATNANTASAIVARDASGNFTAGTVTAALTGNATTATTLATARAINGVNFDGSAAITVTAAAGTLTGTTLASNVVTSSLTAVGTIVTGVWQGTAIANSFLANSSVTINSQTVSLGGSVTVTAAAGTLTGTTLASNVTLSSLTSVGTLSAGAVPASLVTAGTFGAGAYTFPGALAITGAFTGATTGAFSGKITSTVGNNAIFFDSVSATTGYQSTQIKNTGAWMILGIEGSTASSLVTNDTAYSTVLVTQNATDLILGTNQTMNLKIASGGAATFSSTLAATTGTFSTSAAIPITGVRTDAAGVLGVFEVKRSATTIGYIGMDASDNFALISGAGAVVGLKMSSAGLITIPGAATFSSTVSVTSTITASGASGGVPTIDGSYSISIANGAAYTNSAYRGMVLITDKTSGETAIVIYNNGAGTVVSQTGSQYTGTIDTASKVNVFASSGTFKVQNNLSTRNFGITVFNGG